MNVSPVQPTTVRVMISVLIRRAPIFVHHDMFDTIHDLLQISMNVNPVLPMTVRVMIFVLTRRAPIYVHA